MQAGQAVIKQDFHAKIVAVGMYDSEQSGLFCIGGFRRQNFYLRRFWYFHGIFVHAQILLT